MSTKDKKELGVALDETGRRNLLKKLSAGGAAAWVAPIVTAVSIPAHAQTSRFGLDQAFIAVFP